MRRWIHRILTHLIPSLQIFPRVRKLRLEGFPPPVININNSAENSHPKFTFLLSPRIKFCVPRLSYHQKLVREWATFVANQLHFLVIVYGCDHWKWGCFDASFGMEIGSWSQLTPHEVDLHMTLQVLAFPRYVLGWLTFWFLIELAKNHVIVVNIQRLWLEEGKSLLGMRFLLPIRVALSLLSLLWHMCGGSRPSLPRRLRMHIIFIIKIDIKLEYPGFWGFGE